MSNATSLRVPKYGKHKATGQARVQLDGRTIYLGKYGSAESHEAYRRLIAEWSHGKGIVRTQAGPLSISQLMLEYLRHARTYYRKHGRITREYEQIAECCRFIKKLYGRTVAAEFGPLRLKAVRECMIKADHSRGFINDNIDRIRRMFKWAAAEELVPASVPQALSMVAGLKRGRCEARETDPVLPVPDTVVEETLEHLPDVVADMVRLQRLTGMRPQEVCIMRPCDLDRSNPVWIYRPKSHKTEHHGRERVVFIGPKAQEILVRYLLRNSETYCFRPCDSEAKRQAERRASRKTPLSCGNVPGSNRVVNPKRQAGKHYDTNAYRRAIHRACDKAFPVPPGLEGAAVAKWQSAQRSSPNQLRHSAATEIRKQFGLEAAQVILGHASAEVSQIYAERDLLKGLEVAASVG